MKKSSKNRDFTDFSEIFLTEEDCLEYFKKIRWKRGFVCPPILKKYIFCCFVLIITKSCDIIMMLKCAHGLIVIWAVSTARLEIFPPFFLSFFNKTISNF